MQKKFQSNCTVNSTTQAKKFTEWIADNNAVYELRIEPGTVTQTPGKTLDLVISR